MTATAYPEEPADGSVFTQEVGDSPRARTYMGTFDTGVEGVLRQYDAERGLIHHVVPDGAPGVPPHVADLDRFARKSYISPLNQWAYRVGRSSASAIGTLAYAYAQPLSRYHGDPAILRAVSNGFEAFIGHQDPSGEFVFTPIRYSSVYGTHEMAWRLECFITAFFCVRDDLTPDQRHRYWRFLNRAMRFLQATPCDHPCNRGMVWTAVMAMCWRATGDETYLRDARDMWSLINGAIFHESGQVNEGPGPDIVYSPISYEYLLRFRAMTGDRGLDQIIRRSTDWFAEMYTEHLDAFQGASTRHDGPHREHKAAQLLMGFELLVETAPQYANMSEALLATLARRYPSAAAHHGSITWMTTGAAHRPEAVRRALGTPRPTWVHHYGIDATDYYTVGQPGYQTMISLRGLPEKKGVQTWAVRGEPPFVFPGERNVSTVRAWGYDLAARDVTKDERSRFDPSAIPSITAWHGNLVVTYLLGPRTMVVVHTFPSATDRETVWCSYHPDVGKLVMEGNRVIAEGAAGALHWWGAAPTLTDDRRQVRFRNASATQVYAFASGSFSGGTCEAAPDGVLVVEWTDSDGTYRAYVNHTDANRSVAAEDSRHAAGAGQLEPGQAWVGRD